MWLLGWCEPSVCPVLLSHAAGTCGYARQRRSLAVWQLVALSITHMHPILGLLGAVMNPLVGSDLVL